MQLSTATTPPQTLVQEVCIVLCIDSTLATLEFWKSSAFPMYVLPILKALSQAHSGPTTRVVPRLGCVVYTRSTINPPIITNTYFGDVRYRMVELQNNPIELGLGAVTRAGESGMATLEGLVAAVEMCETFVLQNGRKSKRPLHPNLPKSVPKKPPICHIILIGGTDPPGGSRIPTHNKLSQFDKITLDTLPAEIKKRGIKFSCMLPGPNPVIDEFFKKVGDPEDKPWLTVTSPHSLHLSGCRPPNDASFKRPLPQGIPNDGENEAKRAKVATSPELSNRATGVSPPTSDPRSAVPPPVEPSTKPDATEPPPTNAASQEYSRAVKEKMLANYMKQQASMTVPLAPANPPSITSLTAEAINQQQRMLQAKMNPHGVINPGGPSQATSLPGPAPGGGLGEWHGTISFVIHDSNGIPRDVHLGVKAKPGGNKQQTPQFSLWPQRLAFSIGHLRQYDIQEFGQTVRSNGIPLCLFEPSTQANGLTPESAQANERAFALLHHLLTSKRAGAAIFVPTPARLGGTGLFLFAPPAAHARTLVGAVFFSQPIPSLLPLSEVSGINGTRLNTTPQINQPPIGAGAPGINGQLFAQNAIDLRPLQHQQGQQPWMQNGTPGVGSVNSMAAAMAAARMQSFGGGMPGQNQIPPQAQVQNRLLAGGQNVNGPGMGVAGYGVPMGTGNMPNNMSQGMNMMGMGGLTPEMLRTFQAHFSQQQGNP